MAAIDMYFYQVFKIGCDSLLCVQLFASLYLLFDAQVKHLGRFCHFTLPFSFKTIETSFEQSRAWK